MNINTNRVLTGLVLAAGLAPLLTFALVSSPERRSAEQAFESALAEATAEYQRTRSLPALERRYALVVEAEAPRVRELMRKKRSARMQMAHLRSALAEIERRTGTDVSGGVPAWMTEDDALALLLRYGRSAEPFSSGGGGRAVLLRRMLVASLRSGNGSPLPIGALEDDPGSGMARTILTSIAQAENVRTRLAAVTAEHDALVKETLAALPRLESAAHGLAVTQAQRARIAQTMEEVHGEVLKMQGALARIDAKIRARIERDLIAKGLLTPGAIDHSVVPASPTFAWPAFGALTARFQDSAYLNVFGFPHQGLDIALGQGSPVFAAADGIVFLARDGGERGYSYVLVGHRGGYATLYGHLSGITVTAGQDLRQGEAVGVSGGTPGTRGAGPTTTGPHLHFEVIKDGTNIDPQVVLP